MGLLDAGYAFFEFTGQKLLDIYDIISSAPAIVKIFQNNSTKKNRRREKGLAGKFLTPKRGITKNKHKHIKSKDSHIIVTPRSQKLSLAITPSLHPRDRSASTTPAPSTPFTVPSTPFAPTTPFTQQTPAHAAPSTTSPGPTPAPEKIQKLESELTKLREEIAKLMNQPKGASTQGGAAGTVSFASQQVVPQSFVPTPTPTPPTATIPPPPPPPPPSTLTTSISAPSMSASTPVPPPPPPPAADSTPKLYRSASSVEPNTNTPGTPKKEMPRAMSLADVLKGASSANLRKTDMSRSPGGTPLETPTKATNRMSDPQDFIAQALRKKFASINKYNTPETTSKRKTVDGDSGWDESPPPSPERTRKYIPISYVQDENVPPTGNRINA